MVWLKPGEVFTRQGLLASPFPPLSLSLSYCNTLLSALSAGAIKRHMGAFLLLSACAALGAAERAPAFIWSPKALRNIERSGHFHGETSADEVEKLVNSLAPLTEVAVAFVVHGPMGTSHVRANGLPLLEQRMRASISSLTLPFATAAEFKLFDNAVRVAGAEAEAYFQGAAGKAALTNGKPDVVVVELDAQQLSELDALADRIAEAVDAGSKGNYAAVLTAESAVAGPRRLAAKGSVTFLNTHPTLLTAQMVMLLIFIIFMSGFCCLFQLQTPKRFETPKEH